MKLLTLFITGIALIIILSISCTPNTNSPTESNDNSPPRIEKITANPSNPTTSVGIDLICIATDPDGDNLSYIWESANGWFVNNVGFKARWESPNLPGFYSCTVIISDGAEIVQDSITITTNFPNRSPIQPYNPSPSHGTTNVSTTPILTWECTDPDGDPITYDIWFGKGSYEQLVKMNHTENSYSPGVLEVGGYRWRITARDDHGSTTHSDWWSFGVGQ